MDAHWYKTDLRELWLLNLKWKSRLAHLTVKITVPLPSSVVFTPSYLVFGCFLLCFHKNSDTKNWSKAFPVRSSSPTPARQGRVPSAWGLLGVSQAQGAGLCPRRPRHGTTVPQHGRTRSATALPNGIISPITSDQGNPTVTSKSGRRWHAREKDEAHCN